MLKTHIARGRFTDQLHWMVDSAVTAPLTPVVELNMTRQGCLTERRSW